MNKKILIIAATLLPIISGSAIAMKNNSSQVMNDARRAQLKNNSSQLMNNARNVKLNNSYELMNDARKAELKINSCKTFQYSSPVKVNQEKERAQMASNNAKNKLAELKSETELIKNLNTSFNLNTSEVNKLFVVYKEANNYTSKEIGLKLKNILGNNSFIKGFDGGIGKALAKIKSEINKLIKVRNYILSKTEADSFAKNFDYVVCRYNENGEIITTRKIDIINARKTIK